MPKAGFFAFIFAGVCLLTILVGGAAAAANLVIPKSPSAKLFLDSTNLVKSPIDSYNASGQTRVSIISSVSPDDARPLIVDNFLAKNHSPMIGMGKTFVFEADRYGIDWKLLPAIAFQESSLGKNIPKNSYNAFGWGVYSGENSGASFTSWQDAIEKVARGIKERYISKGLTSPEAIMTRYTPNDDGTWVFAVKTAMDEMEQ